MVSHSVGKENNACEMVEGLGTSISWLGLGKQSIHTRGLAI